MNSNKDTEKMYEVSLFRLYLLRALYLLIVVGLGIVQWPEVINQFIQQENSWELMDGVVACMLTAFSLLSILGLRYPLQMLPLLLWELVWKSIWLIVVALPLWSAGQMDESTLATAYACLMVVIVPFVIPWRFVFAHYVKKRGDRLR
ncbi:hypothetical protein [Psychrobacillus sp. OK032]|uniref:hypothetical protein n=1 Tax=Psychrobacillus sp. OK032 TaxID=1884358 RepID=UPI0008ADE8EE|nr:hypothetical protein [Psychrobacillus sp. OK032]SES46152.1 hypothetical protein SAMN05518872_1245 [Psychrobacillus sp. OK032]